MGDQLNISSIEFSPICSSIDELPIVRNKIGVICKIAKKSVDNDLQNYDLCGVHSLSDSDDDEELILNNISGNNLLESVDEVEKISSSPVKYSQNSKKLKKTNERFLEKQRLKEIKEQEKAERAKEKADAEILKQTKPDQCLKYITALLDENLVNSTVGRKAIELFQNVEFKYEIKAQSFADSVTWIRNVPDATNIQTDEKCILFIYSFDKLATSIKDCMFINNFKEIKHNYPEYCIHFATYGQADYYRKFSKNNAGRKNEDECTNGKRRKTIYITKDQIDNALIELLLFMKISTTILKNHQELASLIQYFTKAVAEAPFKKELDKNDEEKNWIFRCEPRDCVHVDNDFNGFSQLWLQQLSAFNNSSLDSAKAIAELYPSPIALYQAYSNLSNDKEKECLLENIQVRRKNGSTRRLGIELSKKLYLLFGQEDGEVIFSQE